MNILIFLVAKMDGSRRWRKIEKRAEEINIDSSDTRQLIDSSALSYISNWLVMLKEPFDIIFNVWFNMRKKQ